MSPPNRESGGESEKHISRKAESESSLSPPKFDAFRFFFSGRIQILSLKEKIRNQTNLPILLTEAEGSEKRLKRSKQ